MIVNYFENELHKAQQRFNETFGRQTICNLKTRRFTMLAITAMGRNAEKIVEAKDKTCVRYEIARFNKARTRLEKLFTQFIQESKERRSNEHCPIDKKEIPCVGNHAGG